MVPAGRRLLEKKKPQTKAGAFQAGRTKAFRLFFSGQWRSDGPPGPRKPRSIPSLPAARVRARRARTRKRARDSIVLSRVARLKTNGVVVGPSSAQIDVSKCPRYPRWPSGSVRVALPSFSTWRMYGAGDLSVFVPCSSGFLHISNIPIPDNAPFESRLAACVIPDRGTLLRFNCQQGLLSGSSGLIIMRLPAFVAFLSATATTQKAQHPLLYDPDADSDISGKICCFEVHSERLTSMKASRHHLSRNRLLSGSFPCRPLRPAQRQGPAQKTSTP
jgi:hypothetical protein